MTASRHYITSEALKMFGSQHEAAYEKRKYLGFIVSPATVLPETPR
jgi:hypothetical protein